MCVFDWWDQRVHHYTGIHIFVALVTVSQQHMMLPKVISCAHEYRVVDDTIFSEIGDSQIHSART